MLRINNYLNELDSSGGAAAGSMEIHKTSIEDAYEYAKKHMGDLNKYFPNFKEDYKNALSHAESGKYKRSEMPVISSRDYDKFTDYLSTEKIKWKKKKVAIDKLYPSQYQIYLSKVVLGVKSNGLKKSVDWISNNGIFIISKDNKIIDGHHRYLTGMLIDKNMKVNVIQVDINMNELIKVSNHFSDNVVNNKRNENTGLKMLSISDYILEETNTPESTILCDINDNEFKEFIGESYDMELSEKAWSDSDGSQPWKGTSLPKNPSREDVEKWFDKEVKSIALAAEKEFKRGMNRLSQNAKSSKVLYRMKTAKSILSKIVRGKDASKMHDILAGAILVKTEEDVKTIDKKIKGIFKLYERETKDFKGDKDYGYYGSYHYLVDVGNGVLAEIQVMTKTLWNTKEEAHKIYTKTREKIKTDPGFAKTSEFAKLKNTSKKLFMRGNGNKGIKI